MGEKMKKAGKVMGITIMSLLPGIIAFYFLLSFIIAPAVNDHIAKKLYKEMVQVPLPEGAVVCDGRFLAGNLVGNGKKRSTLRRSFSGVNGRWKNWRITICRIGRINGIFLWNARKVPG